MKHRVKHIHFVGIGGVGMCGIAEVLYGLGFTVSGSDMTESATSKRLIDQGIRVFYGHDATYMHGADVVVTSTAVKSDNPEVLEARANKIPVIPRALMLAELMRFKQGIAIAGTHGKTTTTSLTASVLGAAGLDPTFVIGGKLTAAGTNARLGSGEFLVAEADESDASFLHLTPVMAVVTNIDADHMDTYDHSFDKLKQAFVDFLQRLPFYGRAVLCVDDPNVREIRGRITKPVTTYGLDDSADIYAENVRAAAGQMHFDVVVKNGKEVRFPVVLNMPGRHNVLNALSAIAIGLECGASVEAIQQGLAEFAGVGRRFQRYGEVPAKDGGSFTLVDDYGHHPVEMAATLAAVRGAFPDKRLVLAFQPHRYTRTRDLFEDFVKVLSSVDALLLSEVYAAGEAPIVAADGRALARAVRVLGKVEPVFVEDIVEMQQTIFDQARDGDVVVTMGAGSIGAVPAKVAAGA
ncbi:MULTISPECIES: UDP-N-acetylmuramate--L-alanine ligase [Chromobacterium]|uniref:UDP-N-acetylmuramate--L-alanine ligase n=4 Tax=Chromobacterium TaxID=535 RepID=A0ABS3GM64_9NEIS|nr:MULTISPECIES: UDP-N-acetylmuramate--L-alanine ligase [Chromobacterium]AXT44914.1 UDP-N-acetylmuramate--L-alanine ligase [Chromobacterium rhizoryzae]MBK0414742.1 UDP-N-acetylmuramate--L-alanine ligase [Chromobacterium haemolyticum]MBO0416121.1 UDP-N-acetylmuramate--L-alanine ligase [Chromobacterium haemolyticum]MBO0499380.1 UDP-N-acetylmuramate--L-alanine ligase [Chromobacterium haemolyticum]PTU72171.1 UDP-N-acetylmuramate--L-alanine ligase [Chromobacterium haemolyticum]